MNNEETKKNKINLPNKLTIARMIAVPILILIMAVEVYNMQNTIMIGETTIDLAWLKYVSFGLFVAAAITDFLDGKISRAKGLVTNFGKIMDPLADKLLVSSAFIMLTAMGKIPGVITAIVIARDFLINGFRMFASAKDVVIPAAWSGKIKTASQLIGLAIAMLDEYAYGTFLSGELYGFEIVLNVSSTVFITVALLATIYSAIDYTIKLGKYIDPTK